MEPDIDPQVVETAPTQPESSFLDDMFKEAEKPEAPETSPNTEPEVEAAVEEPKVEEDPDLADVPKSFSEASKIGWKELKKAKRAVEEERDKLRQELEDAKKNSPAKAEDADLRKQYEELKKQATEYERHLALVNVEQTKEYQENIAQPLALAESTIQEYVQAYSLNLDSVVQAVMKPSVVERNKALAEITADMNEYDKFSFAKVLEDARSLYGRAQDVKAKAKESLDYVSQQRQQEETKRSEESKRLLSEATEKIHSTMGKKFFGADGDKEIAAKIDKKARESDIFAASPETIAYAKYSAVALPHLVEKLQAKEKKIAELEAAISKRSAASPSVGGGSIPAKTDAGDKSFMDGLMEAANR